VCGSESRILCATQSQAVETFTHDKNLDAVVLITDDRDACHPGSIPETSVQAPLNLELETVRV